MEVLAGVGGLGCLPAPRYLTYRQAEEEVRRLAALLTDRLGPEKARSAAYTAIPRGGLFVLGMLSYMLDLPRSLVLARSGSAAPLILVDDVCLGGGRFRQLLQSLDQEEIIFAHLYSHPDARAAILRQEPRVSDCLAAGDLRDLSSELYPDEEERAAWRARWQARFEDGGPVRPYWVGLPEPVAFPWSEPDHPYWNADTRSVEDHWRLIAPDRCLKNWARLGLAPRPEARRRLRSPDGVAFSLQPERIRLWDRRTDQVFGLEGTAAEMWRALVAYGDPEVAADHLLSLYAVEPQGLRRDLDRFAGDLLRQGLLEPSGDGAETPRP